MARNTPVTAGLARVLAGTAALAVKTQNFHWNVEGPHFAALHGLFEGQYGALQEASDTLAERIRALGDHAPGGLGAFAALSPVGDAPAAPPSAEEMVAALAEDHRRLSGEAGALLKTAEEAGDEVTVDMMIARMTEHDKTAWMLDAHLR
ncbi:MAG: DNA starvation/stationary phase protection protein [Alphaproteobacteria bacterium]|nr:DNA starvation/stationary phase protection protein [Alphaproteobacteria bacterium]MYE01713.1 DNA starvation/stationary phase protection protein [Alphaproteobacteria bacterium]